MSPPVPARPPPGPQPAQSGRRTPADQTRGPVRAAPAGARGWPAAPGPAPKPRPGSRRPCSYGTVRKCTAVYNTTQVLDEFCLWRCRARVSIAGARDPTPARRLQGRSMDVCVPCVFRHVAWPLPNPHRFTPLHTPPRTHAPVHPEELDAARGRAAEQQAAGGAGRRHVRLQLRHPQRPQAGHGAAVGGGVLRGVGVAFMIIERRREGVARNSRMAGTLWGWGAA